MIPYNICLSLSDLLSMIFSRFICKHPYFLMTVTEGWMELFLLFQNQSPEPRAGHGGGEEYHHTQRTASGELSVVSIRCLFSEPTTMQPTDPTTINLSPASEGDWEGVEIPSSLESFPLWGVQGSVCGERLCPFQWVGPWSWGCP